MNIPLNWLKEYIKTNKSAEDLAESFTAIGLMLEGPTDGKVLDLEHRMDRADWLSILGCARDLAAIEKLDLIEPERYTQEPQKLDKNEKIEIKVEAKDLVKRFNTRIFKNIEVKQSPKWLKESLESYGLPSKNNIVDITNYVMVELGQPMHAQDTDKLSKKEIVLRNAKKDEAVTTLLGEQVKVDETTLVLSEGDNTIAIGGIVGGNKTEIDSNTTNIILDAGNYNQISIRKTSRKLGIRNETVLRSEKFLHPHLTQVAIERATKLILELAGGEYYENYDYYPNEEKPVQMDLRFKRIEMIGGSAVEPSVVKDTMTRLGYKIVAEDTKKLTLEIPFFRTDVLVEDDLVSDVLRISNYETLPTTMVQKAPPKEVTPEVYKYENKLRDLFVGLGMHEHITNPLVKKGTDETQIEMDNALNSEQNALRTSIYETLQPVLSVYKKHKLIPPALFEVGLTYHKVGNSYKDMKEIRVIEGVLDITTGDVVERNNELKGILAALFENLGIGNIDYKSENENSAKIYQDKLELGEFRVDSFTLYTENLLKAETDILRVKSDFVHEKTEDITVEVKKEEPLGPVMTDLKEKHKATKVEYVDSFDKEDKTAVTFRIYLNP
jgi:phenylalanyl-tRNA synthetase beta chain